MQARSISNLNRIRILFQDICRIDKELREIVNLECDASPDFSSDFFRHFPAVVNECEVSCFTAALLLLKIKK